MSATTNTELADILGKPIKDALGRLATGAAEDIAAFGAVLAQDAATAAAAGDQQALDHIAAQSRALAEAHRVQVAQEGWALLNGILEGGAGLLVGLINRGLLEVSE